MSRQRALIAISRHHRNLSRRGVRLGLPQGTLESAGYGGFYQVYKSGRIYWHAGTGAHEVHGGILRTYLRQGGHDRNSVSGRRHLGFPSSDEQATRDGKRRMSEFEWGAIYWVHGGVVIHGRLWTAYHRMRRELGSLGYPLSDAVQMGDMMVQFFERGCLVDRTGFEAPVVAHLRTPLLGNPGIAKPDDRELPLQVTFTVPRSAWSQLGEDGSMLASVWQQRLRLRPVGEGSVHDEMMLEIGSQWIQDGLPEPGTREPEKKSRHEGHSTDPRLHKARRDDVGDDGGDLPFDPDALDVKITLSMSPVEGSPMVDRTLYDVILRVPQRRSIVVAPHALYAKQSWRSFGYLHATDLHVSRRLDRFRSILRQARKREAAVEFINFNDVFRDLIRKANALHAEGKIDCIVATGDLVDYIFEKGDNEHGGGNFAFFEELVRGQSPYPDMRPSRHEPLKVPIFTTLGNHDYRGHHYELYFELDVPGSNPKKGFYGPLNLTREDAIAIQGNRIPKLDGDQSLPAVRPLSPKYYLERLNRTPSYVVELGEHRLVMIDTGPDKDILDGTWDALAYWAGFSNEDEKSFADGSPNSVGVLPADVGNLRRALQEAGDTGLVIVGMHAPPLNLKGNEALHFLRETEHATADARDTAAYLYRRDPNMRRGQELPLVEKAEQLHPTWKLNAAHHFKYGTTHDLLDGGVARGEIEDFMELCVGRGAGIDRPVDLVLFGHIHRHVEFRAEWSAVDHGLRYFFDFYTQNPGSYYASQKYGYGEPVHIRVHHRARLGAAPGRVRDHRPGAVWPEWKQLTVPPNERSLDRAASKRRWWQEMRPLFVQTAPTGPIDKNQRKDLRQNRHKPSPAFQGIRQITVRGNVMTEVKHLKADEWVGVPTTVDRPPRGEGAPRPRTRYAESLDRVLVGVG